MADAILLLRLEHHNMAELLTLMEQQLESNAPTDLELLQNIVDYFNDYPEQCHHPVENLIFKKLHQQDANRADVIGELLADHKAIADLTLRVATSLKDYVTTDDGETTQLKEVIQQFINHYRAHMAAEEKTFFPAALETLTKSDWDEIDYDLFDRNDPLFDYKVEAKFRALSEKIKQRAGRTDQYSALIRQTKRLSLLNSIQAFNDMMKKAKDDYRIIKRPDGAYGLERYGEIVIDIPNCSPSRAAWCAYFYVEAEKTGEVTLS